PDLIVAFHQNFSAKFPENLREIVGERVVIIDQEKFHSFYSGSRVGCICKKHCRRHACRYRFFARAIAARTAIALRSVSSRSRAGAESATIPAPADRKSTRLNSSHLGISYAVFCLKKKRTSQR